MDYIPSELITPEQYFELLSKDQLTPKETIQKNSFEMFVRRCEELSSLISPATEGVYATYLKGITKLYGKENLSAFEEKALQNYEEKLKIKKETGQKRKLTLNQAGTINAIIIFVMLLNIGFIIAMAILGRS